MNRWLVTAMRSLLGYKTWSSTMIPASSVKTNHIFCLGMSKSISVSIHSVIGPNADPQNPILAKSCCHQNGFFEGTSEKGIFKKLLQLPYSTTVSRTLK